MAAGRRSGAGFHLQAFRDYLAFERGLSERTLDAYARDLARLTGYLGDRGVSGVQQVTSDHMRDFVYHLKDQGLQATSIRRCLSALRTYFAFLAVKACWKPIPANSWKCRTRGAGCRACSATLRSRRSSTHRR